ncbi:hypothetical protein ACO2CR_21410, partial [Aeromonas caviae]
FTFPEFVLICSNDGHCMFTVEDEILEPRQTPGLSAFRARIRGPFLFQLVSMRGISYADP